MESESKKRRCGPRQGTAIIHPKGVEERYGISAPTRWRWERDGKLPPRDVFIGGVAEGWRPETLAAAERGAGVAILCADGRVFR